MARFEKNIQKVNGKYGNFKIAVVRNPAGKGWIIKWSGEPDSKIPASVPTGDTLLNFIQSHLLAYDISFTLDDDYLDEEYNHWVHSLRLDLQNRN